MHIALHQTVIEYMIKYHSGQLYTQSLNDAGINRIEFDAPDYHNDAELDNVKRLCL